MTIGYDKTAEEQTRTLRPDLDPSASKGQARSYRAFVRILSVANECNDLRRSGTRNAVALIAQRRGITESTVRMILHRAQGCDIELEAQPTARHLLRSRYVEAIRRYCPERAEQLADELMAIRDTEMEEGRGAGR